MGPNDVQIVRVFPRQAPGAPIADDSIRTGAAWQIVVEVEAGATIFGTGAQYRVGGVLRNLTKNTVTPLAAVGPNNWPAAPWNNQKAAIVFAPANIPAANANDLYEVLAFVRVNAVPPFDMSFARSEMFIAE